MGKILYRPFTTDELKQRSRLLEQYRPASDRYNDTDNGDDYAVSRMIGERCGGGVRIIRKRLSEQEG